MSIDIEPTADLASAGLVARELDGDAGKQAHGHTHGPCANCGGELLAEYCHHCGQFSHVHRSLLHILEEAVHGLLHFDTKIIRTLPLLVARPGLLTRRYIDGQRARYVAPFALFLFNIFFMVFCFSLLVSDVTDRPGASAAEKEQGRASLLKQVDEQRATVSSTTLDLQSARSEAARERAQDKLAEAQIELRAMSFALAALDATAPPATSEIKSTVSGFIDDAQFLQLKETYQLGFAAAAWRTAALGMATTVAGPLYLLLILLVTFH